jgi:high mobility group protein B3
MGGTKKVAKSPSQKAKKAKKSKDGPKRPLSAYMFFNQEARKAILAKEPELKLPEVSKKVGEQWKVLKDGDKVKYTKLAEEAKKKYESEKAKA